MKQYYVYRDIKCGIHINIYQREGGESKSQNKLITNLLLFINNVKKKNFTQDSIVLLDTN